MQKHLFLLCSLALCMSLQAQWNLSGNSNATSSSKLGTTNSIPLNLVTDNVTRLRIATDGKVGIGTTSPQQRLHVEGSSNQAIFVSTTALGTSSGSGMIGYAKGLPTASGNRLGYFLVGSRGGAEQVYNAAGMGGYAGGAWTGGSSHPAYLAFETTPSGSATRVERMRIAANGNVGIGTTAPSQRLHVAGKGLFTQGVIIQEGGIVSNSSTGDYGIISTGSYGGVRGSAGTYGVYGESTDGGFGVLGKVTTGGTGVKGEGDIGVEGAGSYGLLGTGTSYGVYGSGPTGVYGSGNGYGVYGTGNTYGVYGYTSGAYGVYGYSTDEFGHGVRGNGFYGVRGEGGTYGLVGGGSYAGVYAYPTGSASTRYAGYFVGNVYTTGSYLPSDEKLKKNVESMTSALDIIKRLNPKAYEFRQDGNYGLMNLPEGKQFGIMAQELEVVLPSMVAEAKFDVGLAKQIKEVKPELASSAAMQRQEKESIDYKAVNYTALIPVLVKAVQEQQAQIEKDQLEKDKLLSRIEKLEQLVNKLTNGRDALTLSSASLGTANPNPAKGTTLISYNIPAGSNAAHLLVTDMKGSVIKQVNLNSRGYSTITLNTVSLAAGTYTYSLYVDGVKADSKQLLIAR